MTDAERFFKAVTGRIEETFTVQHCDVHDCDFEIITDSDGTNKSACPKCEVQYRNDLEIAARRSNNQRCNIEPMYHDATLENFDIPTPELESAREHVRNMIQSKAGKLVMIGANGTGKTHLAVAAVRELRGKIFTMYEITTRIRASYVPGSKETELMIVGELARLPMLAIDEIGRTKGSDAETNWLSFIIDKRHSRGLPLILITNKHTRKTCPKNGCPDCLENYIGNDIMSRLNEDGLVIRFSGDDWRKKKRAGSPKGGACAASEKG